MKKVIIILAALFLIILLVSCVSTGFTEGLYSIVQVDYTGPEPITVDGTQVGTVEINQTGNILQIKYSVTSDWLLFSLREDVLWGKDHFVFSKYFNPMGTDTFEHTIDLNSLGVEPGTVLTFFIQLQLMCPTQCCVPILTRLGINYEIENGGGGASIKANVTAEPYRAQTVEYDWTIEKTAEPVDCMELQPGESGAATFTVNITKGPPQVLTDSASITGVVEVYSNDSTVNILDIQLTLLKNGIPVDTTAVDFSSNPNLVIGEHGFYQYNWDVTGIINDGIANYAVQADVVTDVGPADPISDPFDFTNITLLGEIDEELYVDDIKDYSGIGNFEIFPSYSMIPITLDQSMSLSYIMIIIAPVNCDEIGFLDNTAIATELDTGESISDDWELCFRTPDCNCDLGFVLTQGY